MTIVTSVEPVVKPRPSYYAIIPAHVRYDATLPPNAKLLYGEITALCSVEGFCWASNVYLAKLYGVNVRSIQNWIDALRLAGHILVDPIDGYKRHIRLPEAERAARVKKDAGAKKATAPTTKDAYPHAENFIPPMKKDAPRYEKNCTHSITLSPTKNNTKSIAAAAAPDSSLSLVEEIRQTKEDLSTLTPEAYAALEAEAREVVIATTQDPVRMLARQGKANTTVLCMMRKLKAEAASLTAEAAKGEAPC